MAFSRFAEVFDGRPRPEYSAAWGSTGAFRGIHHFDPNQPRVPSGHPDGGQWTRVAGGWTRIASNEGPPDKPRTRSDAPPTGAAEPPKLPDRPSNAPPGQTLGHSGAPQIRRPMPRIRISRGGGVWGLIADFLLLIIEHYREENSPPDLFGHRPGLEKGVVAATILDDGRAIIGMNSTHPDYTNEDLIIARRLVAKLLKDYPEVMSTSNIGKAPNDAAFHAEATVLLRAARASGGTLAGKTLVVGVDDKMCPTSCQKLLPYIGLALDNPTVTFIDNHGTRRTMRDGRWMD